MDKSAVQQIQETSNIPEIIQHLESKNTNIPLAITPDSMSVQSLEQYMTYASRYRLEFSTTSVNDFIRYGLQNDQLGARCFVDAETMSSQAIFDLGTLTLPQFKEHKAVLGLQKTAAYKAVLGLSDIPSMTQKEASEFIEDWSDMMTIINKHGQIMAPHQAAASLRDLTIDTARSLNSKVEDFASSMSAMEKIEAKNQDDIPSEIIFTCTPFSGLTEKRLSIRVSILTGSAKPDIGFRILRLESLQEEIAEEFKQVLVDAFAEAEIKTFIGRAR